MKRGDFEGKGGERRRSDQWSLQKARNYNRQARLSPLCVCGPPKLIRQHRVSSSLFLFPFRENTHWFSRPSLTYSYLRLSSSFRQARLLASMLSCKKLSKGFEALSFLSRKFGVFGVFQASLTIGEVNKVAWGVPPKGTGRLSGLAAGGYAGKRDLGFKKRARK
ncbi:hypothetical protein KQX54_018979 [Cotesia glomerata]|uniref:Uncharacterized protein n=1 Tax=Cotesia glomerata TaxID=32391 RepID=A0AAV7I9M7_COTGL|nr:hypothetical protein KQX54_018979 [Cotesia glomerata]